jgi:hypothetical protein
MLGHHNHRRPKPGAKIFSLEVSLRGSRAKHQRELERLKSEGWRIISSTPKNDLLGGLSDIVYTLEHD